MSGSERATLTDHSASTGHGVTTGEDGLARCGWVGASSDYLAYHDQEWGRPVHGETALYERLTLEAFQSGLSWLTILRKREAFRAAFHGFAAEQVARLGGTDVDRLLTDATIVRNRLKIEAAVTNARAVLSLRERGGLDALVWSFAPRSHRRPASPAEVPRSSVESVALARALRVAGLVFVGPTTAYAAMQACGLVDDHLTGCYRGVV